MVSIARRTLPPTTRRCDPILPELPEVETIRRQLDPLLRGRAIDRAWAFDSAKFTPALRAADSTIIAVGRRGKYLIFELTASMHRLPGDARPASSELIVHLGMTGSLRVHGAEIPADPYARARWTMSDGETLEFRDVRRFGRIAVVEPGHYASLATLAALGPEPGDPILDSTFWQAMNASRRHVKTHLLSQRPIAGVGNIYADEALWLAGIHPARRRVTKQQSATLLAALREVLSAGIERGGTTLRDYVDADGRAGTNQLHLRCYGRSGQPCVRCGTALSRSVIDARTSTWCPTCQPR